MIPRASLGHFPTSCQYFRSLLWLASANADRILAVALAAASATLRTSVPRQGCKQMDKWAQEYNNNLRSRFRMYRFTQPPANGLHRFEMVFRYDLREA